MYSSFSQSIAISKIVDFNVFDVVTVLLIYFASDSLAGADGRRLDDWRGGRLERGVSGDSAALRQVDLQRE